MSEYRDSSSNNLLSLISGAFIGAAGLAWWLISEADKLHLDISGYEFKRSISFERFNHYDELSDQLRNGRLNDGYQVTNKHYKIALKKLNILNNDEKILFTLSNKLQEWTHEKWLVVSSSLQGKKTIKEVRDDEEFELQSLIKEHPIYKKAIMEFDTVEISSIEEVPKLSLVSNKNNDKEDKVKDKLIQVMNTALKAHKIIGCDGVTRSDFKFYNNKFYLLEINTQPGMTKLSLVPEIAAFKGISFIKLIEWILKDASTKK